MPSQSINLYVYKPSLVVLKNTPLWLLYSTLNSQQLHLEMVMIHIFLTVMVVGGVSLFPETAEAIVMGPSMQKLTWHYYKVYNTCENAENFVRHQVEIFYKNDKSIAPKLLRLLYSDCFVSVRFSYSCLII